MRASNPLPGFFQALPGSASDPRLDPIGVEGVGNPLPTPSTPRVWDQAFSRKSRGGNAGRQRRYRLRRAAGRCMVMVDGLMVDGVVVLGFLTTGTTGFMLRTSLINAPQIRACPIKALGSRRSVRRAKDEDAFLRC